MPLLLIRYLLKEETWDDLHTDEWSAEEYTGSLADTKIFTPSVPPEPLKEVLNEPKPGIAPTQEVMIPGQQMPQTMGQMPHQQPQLPSQSPVPIHGTLNAAQTQYLSQLTQQTSENMKVAHQQPYPQTGQSYTQPQPYTQPQNYTNTTAQSGSQQYVNTQQYGNTSNTYVNSSYPSVNNTYGSVPEQPPVQQTRTKTQRARVPPPSKVCLIFLVFILILLFQKLVEAVFFLNKIYSLFY